jgi:hypothetical protein
MGPRDGTPVLAIPPKMTRDPKSAIRSQSQGPTAVLQEVLVNQFVSTVSEENAVLVSRSTLFKIRSRWLMYSRKSLSSSSRKESLEWIT